ncbi:Methyltransferase domain-containing protein [Micromonospora rhizosphaerae]|uniref:Methyltransferase domain-containing protein n=1 Tax=Micromonospora rhizosphaerae TaxID=568872 RepID=A0A1C6SWL0_9ACTN|nr:class I SAM-dependent methyltransferase [Micromonospora rhizosphaerae]SCL33890.1 Methyltransferase domain-containing protein [Micromonospora rhizosphaerae]
MTTPLDFADWLRLREPADAAARSVELVDAARRRLTGDRPLVVHDLGTGTGSMVRWLAPRLPGPQHWILYDRDPYLLERAATDLVDGAADGSKVTVEVRRSDITRLTDADLADADLVTASALLDMLTAGEVERVVAACADRPTLFMISVVGRVAFTPADPLDAEFAAAFNAHQRRTVDGRALLGPDAVAATVAAFTRRGIDVQVRPSPWRLGPDQAALTVEWLTGWLDAACEQRPELAGPAGAYRRRRLAEAADGRLRVVLQHADLFAGG